MKIRYLFLACLMFVLSLSVSCNIEKRVENHQKTFDNIGRKWLSLHPCANDSSIIYIPGKRDSIPIEIPIFVADLDYINHQIDSVKKNYDKKLSNMSRNCDDEIRSAYFTGYKNAETIYKEKISKIKVPVPVIDTIKITLKDKQQIQLLAGDLKDCERSLNEEKIKSSTKDKWFWWFVIASILFFISAIFNLKKL